MELSEKIIDTLESHEIYIPNLKYLKNVDYVEMEFCSPAGEGFAFSVSFEPIRIGHLSKALTIMPLLLIRRNTPNSGFRPEEREEYRELSGNY